MTETHSGYTLPVFAVAAAKAALQHLCGGSNPIPTLSVSLDLLQGEPQEIKVEQVARLNGDSALGITRSDPGENLDLTRQTPIWAWVSWAEGDPRSTPIQLQGGEGLGHRVDGSPAIYDYARRLFTANLEPLRPPDRVLQVQIILPEGRRLAQRTSNVAFGVLEGLALAGTQGIPQPATTQDFLEQARRDLRQILVHHLDPVLCIGSHGRQVAERLGARPDQILQAANWIGPLLVEAAVSGASSVRLIGYHGKLLKLAGGIFNTSSHVADGRLEILTAAALRVGARADLALQLLQIPTVDQAQDLLIKTGLATGVFQDLATHIQSRSQAYIRKYGERELPLSVVLFDRRGQVWAVQD